LQKTWFRAEKTGTYHGQCSELCGRNHAFMPIVVRVVTDEEFADWLAKTKPKPSAARDDAGQVASAHN
jgi:cytochrome c oxidase subunit 2